MFPAISQVCSLNSSFQDDVADFAAGGCGALEFWLTKLETYVQSHGMDSVRALLDAHSMRAPVASFQGGLLTTAGERRTEAWGLFTRRLDLCRSLGVETVVVSCDILPPITQADIERAQTSLTQIAQTAGMRQMRVALEFQAKAALGNNLQTAAALAADVGSPHLGLCLDVFHFQTGPSKTEDLALLTKQNLFHVQVCDIADTPREFAADADRILPGEGDINLAPVMQRLQDIEYEGLISLELMNPRIWQIPAVQIATGGMQALTRLGI